MAKEEGVYDKLIVLVVKQAYSPMSKFYHGLKRLGTRIFSDIHRKAVG